MHRLMRVLAWLAASLLLLGLLLFGVPNTGPGRRLLEHGIAWASGGEVAVVGLSGRFPDAPRVARITIRDVHGVWLELDDVALDWSPLLLASREAVISRLSAARIMMARQPVMSGGGSSDEAPFLPVAVRLTALHVDRLELAPSVAGVAADLSVDVTAQLTSLRAGRAEVILRRLDQAGEYHLTGRFDTTGLTAQLQAREPANGLAASLAGLPDIGDIAITAEANGPWSNVATHVSVVAGLLRATAGGSVDIAGQAAALDLTATAPAMTPRPNLSWQAVTLRMHLDGPFAQPTASGILRVDGLAAAGATLRTLAADISGDRGKLALHATLDGLRVSGPTPDMFTVAPITLQADANLVAPDRPIRLVLSHPLLSLTGTIRTGDTRGADLTLTLPDLASFASGAPGHASLRLQATMQGETTRLDFGGTLGLTGGPAPLPALIGPDATLAATVMLRGEDVTLRRLHAAGHGMSVDATGDMTGGIINLAPRVALTDLSLLAPTLTGSLHAEGHVGGRQDDLTLDADLTGDIATPGLPTAPVTANLHAQGLPSAPAGRVTVAATLEGAPLTLAAAIDRATDGTLHLSIDRADWNSVHAEGMLTLPPGAILPQGHLVLRMSDLAQLRPLLGSAISGAVDAAVDIDGQGRAKLQFAGRGIGLVDAIRLDANGPQDALAMRLTASGAGTQASATATLDAPSRRLTLSALQADWHGETLRLLAPAHVDFATAVAIDRLRLGLRQAELTLSGRVAPTLDLAATLRDFPAALVMLFMPDTQADGSVQAEARITGTLANPAGTIKLTATGLHQRAGPAAGLPPATVSVATTIADGRARLDAHAALGSTGIALTGSAPLDTAGALDLHASGALDLALLNPLVAANGRQIRGHVALDAGVTGQVTAPQIAGTLRLTDGEVQDFAQGARLRSIQAVIRASDDNIRIDHFTGQAGSGTITLAGSLGLAAPMPLDMTLTAHNATPLASDLLTAVLDADLHLHGNIRGTLAADGSVAVRRADIRIPEQLPTAIAVLDVRRPGQHPPPSPAPGPDVTLNLAVKARQVFVRGRGVDAEMEGALHVGGTTAALQPSGGLTLRRGQYNLVGQTLTFSSGRIGLDGSGKLDPTLNFTATSINNNITAMLTIAGYASAPKIALSSTPTLPQDEVLAQLLFGSSLASLGPLQIAQITAGLAQIAGVGGDLNPLDSIRARLGLDRLSVGGGQNGQGAQIQAGRYVAPGVYVGAKQGMSGTGTQATVQIDLWRNLKLETDVGTLSDSSATAGTSDSGSSVGLTYQFEY